MTPLCSTPTRRITREPEIRHGSDTTEETDYVFYHDYKLEFLQRGLLIYEDADKILENESDSDADSGVLSLDETDDFELRDLSQVWDSDDHSSGLQASDETDSEDEAEPINTPSESTRQVQSSIRVSPVSTGFRAVPRPLFRSFARGDSVARRRLFAESTRYAEDREE